MDYYRPTAAGNIRDIRHELGLDNKDFVILYTGRVVPGKGVDVLLDALALLEDVSTATLVITAGGSDEGIGSYRKGLLEQSKNLNVVWTPRRKDVVPLLQMADVAVVPSELYEAFPRAVCEPLACGVPVVASDRGGIPEIMQGWLAEYLVPSGDARALAEAIRSFVGWRDATLSRPSARRTMSTSSGLTSISPALR